VAAATPAPLVQAAAEGDALVCTPTGAHGKHLAMNFACATCHACGYGVDISTITLPGGTTTAGSTVDRSSGTTTCMTGCHAPFGATPQPVAWNAGPRACTDCHSAVVPPGIVVVSSHPGFGTASVTCSSCHDTSAHTSGEVRLIGAVDSTCQGCHSGTGSTLVGVTPPLLVGWETGVASDPHGERAGLGYGGALLPPYVRQQPALPCTACHDAHASANPFLFAKAVNGVTMMAGMITRAGEGAEMLCQSCHVGDRHAKCAECHVSDPRPAGAPCLSCHTHEGTSWFPWPGGSPADYHDQSQNTSCSHCHDNWARPVETTPPVILYPGNERITVNAAADEATITWDTDEGATSFVEYGTSTLGHVAGDPVITPNHSVRLTGLTENTTYSFRVRSTDVMRNVTLSGVRTFTTQCPTCASTPIPIANASFDTPITATTEQAGGWWRDAGGATYCGTYASAEMTGANVFRITAVPHESCDDWECWTDEGYGAATYMIPRADLDAGTTITFDVRPKYLGTVATVSLALVAFDASGAPITDIAQNKHMFDVFGYSSASASSLLRIPSPVVNTTYTIAVDPRTVMANGLVNGYSWADVAKVWLTLQATSGGVRVEVYFDDFR
jgi:hypothetical protein